MGTIQPARFLSHTGRVLPGVRRIVNVPNPAAGHDWLATVPGGVQWVVLGGMSTLVTSAAVANRVPSSVVTVEGFTVVSVLSGFGVSASNTNAFPIVTSTVLGVLTSETDQSFLLYPLTPLPEGAKIGVTTTGLAAADQWSTISLWVEEIYVTDPQLSSIEIAREDEKRIEAQELQQYLAQTGGGN